MNKFRNYLLAASGLAVLVGSLVLTGSHGSQAQGRGQSIKPETKTPDEVVIVNTTAQPVPTAAQGTTNIAGTVQAQQSGDWNVGISGTPTVTLAPDTLVDTNTLVVADLDNPSRQTPFGKQVIVSLGDLGQKSESFLTPANKRITIEHVSARGAVPAGQSVQFEVQFFSTSALMEHSLLPMNTGDSGVGTNFFVASQPMKVYLEPSTLVIVTARRFGGSGFANFEFSFSGYLSSL